MTSDHATTTGFERLLAALGPDRAAAAREYEALRERLRQRFVWRGAPDPDHLTDVTFDRVADKLAAGEDVRDVVAYALTVARYVQLEAAKEAARQGRALDKERDAPRPPPDEAREHERRVYALERCLDGLGRDKRALVLDYHRGRGQARIDRRKALADAREISVNSLRIRVFRLRQALERCVEDTLGDKPGNGSDAAATPGRGRS